MGSASARYPGPSFVKEIAEPHRGRVALKNAPAAGAMATLPCRSER